MGAKMDFHFEVMFYETNQFTFKRYENKIRVFIAEKLKRKKQSISLQEKKEKRLYRDLRSNVYRFDGNVSNGAIIDKHLFDLINSYCDDVTLNNTLITFHSSAFNVFPCLKEKMKSRNERQLYSLAFGTIVNLNQFVSHIEFGETYGDVKAKSLKAVFEHFKRQLLIEIRNRRHYRFVLSYNSINYIVLSKIAGSWSIYLVLSVPPLLYEVQTDDESIDFEDGFNEQWDDDNQRVIYSKTTTVLRQTTPGDNISAMTTTKSNVIQLYPFSPSNLSSRNHWKMVWSLVFNINRFANTSVYIGKIDRILECIGNPSLPSPRNLPFDVHYAFQCLDNLSYQLHDELYVADEASTFIRMVEHYTSIDPKATEEALYDLFWIKDNNIPVNAFFALESRFEERKKLIGCEKTHENIVNIRRCVITPSRIILLPPLPYLKSRLFRNSNPDFALRVYAKDENFDPLNFTVLGSTQHLNEFFNHNFLYGLLNGIQIRNRRYEYLGSSTSQLREFGMIFYAEDDDRRTARNLRAEIGDLSHIKNPAKYIARLGQAFSQPIAHLPHFPSEYVTVEPDITGGRNAITGEAYVFSDGVGMMSDDLAMELTLLIKKNQFIPFSAFQIRYGGSKGMIAVNPNLRGKRMILRKSMKKFESHSTSIEVLKASEPRYTYLNRPLVNILEQLGVNSSVFMSVARENFTRIIDSFSCKCKALDVIKSFSLLKVDFDALKHSEINIFGEHFFRGILEIVVKNTIKEMKSKARIRISDEYGRTMFGVLDETRTLKEGEVFVQYSNIDDYTCRKVVTGEVLVTKYPCMHPGDVRKFKAVDNTFLNHLCDCIVFPQCGSRPHPDQMAGSDLDGDEYAVIWHPSFLFPGKNHQAMDYTGSNEITTLRHVEVCDMLEFYVDFTRMNNVGTIAYFHLALSDYLKEGIFHEKCIQLAKQYSVSLDYAKSGEIDIEPAHRATCYPDFMEKHETKPTYKSKRALGKLYRLSCLFEENGEFEGILGEQTGGNDSLLTFPGWQFYENDAERTYFDYRSRILHIQRQFDVDDELSLLSGLNLKTQKYVCTKNEHNDVLEMMRFLVSDILNEFRCEFEASISDTDPIEAHQLRKAKASAWYLVTRRINEQNLCGQYNGLPWIVSSILCEIANENSMKQNNTHICNLDKDVLSTDLPLFVRCLQNKQCEKTVEKLLKVWLKNCLKSFRGYVPGKVDVCYAKFVEKHTCKVLETVNQVDIAVDRVLRSLAAELKTGNEFENMLSLTALMTVRRYQRTKLYSSFAEILNTKDVETTTFITCLSLQNEEFKRYVFVNEDEFYWKLKESGVEDVCIHVLERPNSKHGFVYISAFGTKSCFKKLRNALTKSTFYEDVVNYERLNYD